MMYSQHFVLSVLLDGKILPEKNGAVVMPFGSEYKLRLRNKSRTRSVVDVIIDGNTAAKGLVVAQDAFLDLERFVDSLTGGSRFKLAKLTDPGVNQPGDSQNGLIEAKFYLEKEPLRFTVTKAVGHHAYCGLWCPVCNPSYGVTWESSITHMDSGILRSKSVEPQFSGSQVFDSFSAEAAATVKGGQSSQAFIPTLMEIDESCCVTLSLKLMGVSGVLKTCKCGRKRKNEKFCPNCGQALVIG